MTMRHYLYVGQRRVHYRRSGMGPPLVVLPAVPLSSAMVERLVRALAPWHTVIALDAPGYGESAPLSAEPPAVEDYASALMLTLDALAIQRCAVYGVDTSAAVAADFAYRWPDRVRRLVLDRPCLPSETEQAKLLARYCPIIEPDDEGSHLVKYWGRLRDLYTFRPWYRRAIDARIQRDLPSPLDLYHEMVDIFRAGVAYWQGPHAAWRYPLEAVLPRIQAPVTLIDTPAGYDRVLARLGGSLPPGWIFLGLRDPDASDAPLQVAARVREAFAGDALQDAPPPAPAPVPIVARQVRRDYVDSRAGQLLVRRVGSGRAGGGGRPLVLSYGSLFSGAWSEEQALSWAVDRPVVGFDIPGVGDSPAVPGNPTMAEIAEAVVDGIDALGLEEVDLYGSHTSAMMAIEIAIARPGQVKHAILDGVTMFTDQELEDKLPRYFQPLRVTDDGAFLVWSWHFVRDMYLWYPWYDHRGDHFRPDATIRDAAGQHARVVDFLKGGLTFENPYRAAVDFPSRARLPLVSVPTLLCAAPDDTLRPSLPEAASLVPHATALVTPGRRTPEARSATSALFRRFLADEPLMAGEPV